MCLFFLLPNHLVVHLGCDLVVFKLLASLQRVVSLVPEISAVCSCKVMAEYGEKYLGELFMTS